jgi:hypothetical protein
MPDSCKLLAGPAAASAQLLLAVAAIGVLVLKRWHTIPSPAKLTRHEIPKVATQDIYLHEAQSCRGSVLIVLGKVAAKTDG